MLRAVGEELGRNNFEVEHTGTRKRQRGGKLGGTWFTLTETIWTRPRLGGFKKRMRG